MTRTLSAICSVPLAAVLAAGPSIAAQINGAGATLPYPIYSKWFAEYNKLHPDVRINYQSIGSGGGIRQVTNQTVFFGATDSPMTDDQLRHAPGRIVQVPTVIGAVVPIYNVSGAGAELKFSGPMLADIFLGKITSWDDPAIATLNAGAALPHAAITVVHRSDGSGTTFIWTDYLAKVSVEFKNRIGVNSSVNWPEGVGAKGNEGVAGLVKQTPASIGYVELAYALPNRIAYGAVRNGAGEYVKATVDSVTAATQVPMPPDLRVSITNAPGKGAYPIASFTWLLLYENPQDKQDARVMVDFLRWALTDGQKYCPGLGYAPLPSEIAKLAVAALGRIRT